MADNTTLQANEMDVEGDIKVEMISKPKDNAL